MKNKKKLLQNIDNRIAEAIKLRKIHDENLREFLDDEIRINTRMEKAAKEGNIGSVIQELKNYMNKLHAEQVPITSISRLKEREDMLNLLKEIIKNIE